MRDVSDDEGVPRKTPAGRKLDPAAGGDASLRGAQGLQGGEGVTGRVEGGAKVARKKPSDEA